MGNWQLFFCYHLNSLVPKNWQQAIANRQRTADGVSHTISRAHERAPVESRNQHY